MRNQQLRLRLSLAAAFALVLTSAPALAMAHAELVTSSPAAGTNLDAPPSEVVLTFDDELDPAGSSFTVTVADGGEVGSGEVDLDVADRNVMRGVVAVEEAGTYTVAYTVVGVDGHEVSGSFTFGYQAEGSGGGTENPDTALGRPSPLQGLGLALLALSGVFVLARRLKRFLPAIVVLALVTACVPATNLPDDCDADSVQRSATLAGETLDPATIQVCRGQEVTIEFTIERDATLHLHGYDDQVPAEEVHAGDTLEVTFDADQAGQFPIEIHTHDGPAEAEVGTLVVNEP